MVTIIAILLGAIALFVLAIVGQVAHLVDAVNALVGAIHAQNKAYGIGVDLDHSLATAVAPEEARR